MGDYLFVWEATSDILLVSSGNCDSVLLRFQKMITSKKVKVAHTRLQSIWFRSWSRFLAVSLQVMWVMNPAVGCHYFPPGLQLPPQPLRGMLPILLLGEQRHDGCEQFAYDCYLTASRLRVEPGPFCAWVQHANHSATEPPRWSLIYEKFRGNLTLHTPGRKPIMHSLVFIMADIFCVYLLQNI